ncbi:transmembrane glucosamine N-acetyltransferase NagX [Ferrimonas gelatinilytica]|uniref:DUF5009 domain-containing protein n=1 Tax=Ferrimonas gelatinilytica TaxID=1255257 RepID=A0ABP9S5X1_9GAMM
MTQATQPQPGSRPRLLSIDALRGFDMFWILGGEGLFAALLVLTGWSGFQLAANQMEHSAWHGVTAYDLIFPLFIFLSGVTLGLKPLALRAMTPSARWPIYRKALKRLALLCLLGVVYNHGWGGGIPLAPDAVRYASVLGRIGMAWFLAAMIVWHLSLRAQLLAAGLLMLAYGLTQGSFGADPYSAAGSLNAWVDQALLPGQFYGGGPLDPEGLFSHLSAALNALAGAWVGRWLSTPYALNRRLALLAAVGSGLLLTGYGISPWIPLNKTLWTVSFVLVSVGWSGLLLALFALLIDGWGWHRPGRLFALIGGNAIAIYLASALVDWGYLSRSLMGGVIDSLPAAAQPLLACLALLAVQLAVLAFLARHRLFFKV